MQGLRPEAGVQQVHHGVFRAAHVHIHRQPVSGFLLVEGGLVVLRVGEAQEVPRRAGERAHGIRLAAALAATRQSHVGELGDGGQRRLARGRRLVAFDVGQSHRQFIFRHGGFAVVGVNDRDRRAPITLAADSPVTQFVVDSTQALACPF